MRVEDVEFVKELYPRIREDDAAIERYRAALDRLPPIVVARGRVLVDGFHRWQAYRREGVDEVVAVDLGNLTDTEILRESIRRNATHGHQLSGGDKKLMADRLWRSGTREEGELCELLSVTPKTLDTYLRDAKRDEKEQQKAKAWGMWLDCHSQVEIAAALEVTQQTVSNWLQKIGSDPVFSTPPASRQHFDVWSFQKADGDSTYFGKMPPQVVENLLWLFTEPGDIVVDPFAGGGTTIDVAKAMGRRVWASDISPSTPTLPIHEHDITTGWPGAPKADLVLLDPPYWRQAKGRYTDRPTDLSNMTLDEFNDAWARVAAGAMANGKRAAYIVSPTQLEDGTVVDHATQMLAPFVAAGWRVERRIIVTYTTQQANGQQVEWAKENKRLLKLYRDLVVVAP